MFPSKKIDSKILDLCRSPDPANHNFALQLLQGEGLPKWHCAFVLLKEQIGVIMDDEEAMHNEYNDSGRYTYLRNIIVYDKVYSVTEFAYYMPQLVFIEVNTEKKQLCDFTDMKLTGEYFKKIKPKILERIKEYLKVTVKIKTSKKIRYLF